MAGSSLGNNDVFLVFSFGGKFGCKWVIKPLSLVREHVYFRGKFVKKANHLANCVKVTSNSKKSDVAKFATCSEPI